MRIDCKTLSLSAFLFALLCLSSVGDASPPSAGDNVHFCRVLDYEDMRERDSLYAATKHALNLNVGEPRTVRMIYFLPNDRPFRQEVVDSMKVTIRQIQTFYAEQMQAHGYGGKTFRFETDAEGEPMVHRVDGQHPDSHYLANRGERSELWRKYDFWANNVYLIVIDNSTNQIGDVGGEGSGNREHGFAVVPGGFHWETAAHELGHAFGLDWHDFRDDAYIMSYGSKRDRLSACHADFLAVHPYFNPNSPTGTVVEGGEIPLQVELISPGGYLGGSESISIQLKVNDQDGIHQVLMFVPTITPGYFFGSLGVKACRRLAGEKNAVVEFDYDGRIPSNDGTSLSNPLTHTIEVLVVNTKGYVSNYQDFGLWNKSIARNIIATFENKNTSGYWRDNQGVWSMAFSPDGSTLAFSSYGVVKLWDVATQTEIATLKGYTERVHSVAFSPDGAVLASAEGYGPIKLWDVVTRTNTATLEGHTDLVNSMAFSPDGTILASGSWDGTVKLWDVATWTNITTLEGHTRAAYSVAFSPDGTMLASGSHGIIKLWDVVTQTEVATLGHRFEIDSVAFSPDGTMLASGSWDGTIKLWDIAMRTNTVTLEAHTDYITSVAFSPDGSTLASGSWDKTIKLWDIATGDSVATFRRHPSPVFSLAFLPYSTTLASGGVWAVVLWDMSEYVTPVVYIPDANLQAVIRDALGKSRFAPITVTDMASLTALDASNCNIRDLTGLESATNLTELNLLDNRLSSLSINTHIPALQDRGVEVLFDKTPTPDFDGDGVVGFADFLLFVAQFGSSEDDEGYDVWFDLDGDGMIGFGDFLIFANAFGKAVSSN